MLNLIFSEKADNETVIESTILAIISNIHLNGPVSGEEMEFLAHSKRLFSEVFKKHEGALLQVMGLFYKSPETSGTLDYVYNMFNDAIQNSTGKLLTPVQSSIYNEVTERRYFSFSAPTSTGKSHVFREIIKEAKDDIAIIVPSRALIAEYMFEIKKILSSDKSVLILDFAENVNRSHTSRRIYVLTPERAEYLFSITSEINLSMVLFDEAQISEEEFRGVRFDAIVKRLDKELPQVKKVFTHPFVSNPEAQLKKHNFHVNSAYYAYEQHSTGKIFINHNHGQFLYFSPYNKVKKILISKDPVIEILQNNGTLLVFTSKANIYSGKHKTEFEEYIKVCEKVGTDGLGIIKELEEFIGASEKSGEQNFSEFLDLMKLGVVIHHGSIPLKGRLLIERFVNDGHAKICFATSTLLQGINMPFDIVWIDNFVFRGVSEENKVLGLKNLIGRAGRTTKKPVFEHGYVIVNNKNVKTFIQRMGCNVTLSETSKLDSDIDDVSEDLKDLIEAVKNDTFDSEYNLTELQKERIEKSDSFNDISLLLDLMFDNGSLIGHKAYDALEDGEKDIIKGVFKQIYLSHLRKSKLNKREETIISVAITVMLMKVRGWSFRQIVGLRASYITKRDLRRKINKEFSSGGISKSSLDKKMRNFELRYSQEAEKLPTRRVSPSPLFDRPNNKLGNFNYDWLVYDTYDYLDKVIALSLVDPICAALDIFFKKHSDARAKALFNYIKFGTNDEVRIWLMKYGFDPEDIDWIEECVKSISANEIKFNETVKNLEEDKYEVIHRFITQDDLLR